MHWRTKQATEAVERWASDWYFSLRETEIGVQGRVDLLLIPINPEAHCMKTLRGPYFDRVRLAGVEVKVSREDFLKGINKKQFQRYQNTLSALYVATLPGVCKTNEIPEGVGHLTINTRKFTDWRCICRRRPKYIERQYDASTAWRILFKIRAIYHRRDVKLEDEYREKLREIGEVAGDKVFRHLKDFGDWIDTRGQS